MSQTVENLVLGGGMAGTALAVHLHHAKKDFLLIEADNRLGGKVKTKLAAEACYEFGPHSFMDQPADIVGLLQLLGMEHEILKPAPASKNRYILKQGKIVRLPFRPLEIFTTQALSLRGRLRLLREIFYVPKKTDDDESVWDFFARHFGKETADFMADPFVSGITAGDAKHLSLASAFPAMAGAEGQSSSLIRHLILNRKSAGASPLSCEMKRGLESIFVRAHEMMGRERVHTGEKVVCVAPGREQTRVFTDRGAYEAAKVFLAVPAAHAAFLLQETCAEAARLLLQITYAPVVVAHLRVSKKEAYPFDGFGILIPSLEKRKILGVLWNSSSFPDLFSDRQHHYLTVFAGGVCHRDLTAWDDSRLAAMIGDEVKNLFALNQKAELIHLHRHSHAIPQYVKGYEKITAGLSGALALTPSLKLAGNYLGGISMPKTVAHAVSLISSVKFPLP